MEFFDYYENLFGERWPALLESLKGEGCATELRFGEGLEPYYLDEASVFAANALDVQPGDDVLDMCAAPGGKTLVIASLLKGEGSDTERISVTTYFCTPRQGRVPRGGGSTGRNRPCRESCIDGRFP